MPSNSEIEAATEITPEMKKKQMVVGISFLLFVLALILDSLTDITVNPNFIGYALIAVSVLTTVVKPKEVITSFGVDMVLFCAGINLIIAVMKNSGLGEVFGAVVLSILGDTKNLYLITAVLFLGSAIATQFMNNMATAGVLAPIGISIAESMGANPQAIVLAIAIGAVIGLLNVNISFFTATIPTGLVYYFGMKYMKSCKNFRKGTTLENK